MQEQWITTFTKKKFYPFKPDTALICIEDIAHVLSIEPRWGAHAPYPYSVGEHSLAVARLCSPKHRIYGLLHDAHEAYLRDIPRPVKYRPGMEAYRAGARFLQVMIHSAFRLENYAPPGISEIDNRMLVTESIAFGMPLAPSDMTVEPYPDMMLRIDRPWRNTKTDFIDMFMECIK